MTSTPMQIEKLDAPLGARVEGLDLRSPLDDDVVSALRSALFEHQLLFFRDQPLDDDQHIDFASHFGTPQVYPIVEMLGQDKPIEFVADGPKSKPVAENWHTDVTWLQDPPKIGMLSAQVMPDEGGDTLWCNLYSVYESLSTELRDRIEHLIVAHRAGQFFEQRVLGRLGEAFIEQFRERYGDGARHALVRDHYVTGRRLAYLAGGFMDHVVDMNEEEGRALLRSLMEIADDPAHFVRWKWQVGDVGLWDERSTMHRVDTSHWPEPRVMRRCTIS